MTKVKTMVVGTGNLTLEVNGVVLARADEALSNSELPRPKGKRLSVFKDGASGFIKSKQFSN